MKILITGSNGFFGRHAVEYLKSKGHNITAYNEDIRKGLPKDTFDAILPFAAKLGGRKGMTEKIWNVTGNIELDRITFQWAEKHCGKIIYPSSCAVYPTHLQKHANIPIKEDTVTSNETFDMYATTKLVAERMLEHMNIPVHIVRPFSVYGPTQSTDYPFPNIIARAKRGECSVWGSGKQTRDWVHILDVIRVFEFLLEQDKNITLNVGTGRSTTFIEAAEIIYNAIHGHKVDVITQTNEPEGAGHRLADTNKLSSFGLLPKITLEQGIKELV